MSSRKQLGPPKGAGETAAAARQTILGGRFSNGGEDTGTPASSPSTPDSEAGTPGSHSSHTRVDPPRRTPRGEPAGMTRRTYYLTAEAADALEEAVATVRAATGGRVTKAEALAALIGAGADRAEAVGAQLREALLRDLQQ